MNELRDYQYYVLNELLDKKKAGCFLDMGLGKSRIAIELLMLLQRPLTLVVAPAMVVKTTWEQEFARWDPDAKIKIVTGTPTKRKLMFEMNDADVYVLSRDNVDWLWKTFGKQLHFDVVILDESSSFKNPSSKRWKAIRYYCNDAERVIEMTGTPVGNSMIDLWGQIELICPGRLGKFLEYKQKYFTGPVVNGYQIYNKIRRGAEEIINESIKDLVFSMKSSDHLRLPERIDNLIRIQMDGKLMNRYKIMRKHYCLEAENAIVTAANAAVVTEKLCQLSNGFIYGNDKEEIEFSRHKLDWLEEIFSTSQENILVFAMFQRDISEIEKLGAVKLNSDKLIKEFQQGKIKFAVCHPASIGYGINLQEHCHTLIWYSLPWSLEQYTQGCKRLHRQGQDQTVTVNHLLTTGTIEEQIYEALQTKNLTQETLLVACRMQIEDAREAKI